METVAFRMTLKPGMREEYEKRHREIWPELADALRDAGIREYRIFLDESTGHLFAIHQRTDTHTTDALPALAHHAQVVGLHGRADGYTRG